MINNLPGSLDEHRNERGLTENPFTQHSESQIREQHNEIEFFRMTF